MDIFDKIGNMASETYKFTTEKTGKLAREAKLKMRINESKSKINDIYVKIGEIVYQNHVREEKENIEEDINKLCEEIDNYSKQIESCRLEILNLKDRKQCNNCFTEIDLDAKYCSNCGAEQPEIEIKEAQIVEDTEEVEENNDT